jgi:hypothetical protein
LSGELVAGQAGRQPADRERDAGLRSRWVGRFVHKVASNRLHFRIGSVIRRRFASSWQHGEATGPRSISRGRLAAFSSGRPETVAQAGPLAQPLDSGTSAPTQQRCAWWWRAVLKTKLSGLRYGRGAASLQDMGSVRRHHAEAVHRGSVNSAEVPPKNRVPDASVVAVLAACLLFLRGVPQLRHAAFFAEDG